MTRLRYWRLRGGFDLRSAVYKRMNVIVCWLNKQPRDYWESFTGIYSPPSPFRPTGYRSKIFTVIAERPGKTQFEAFYLRSSIKLMDGRAAACIEKSLLNLGVRCLPQVVVMIYISMGMER